MPPPPSTICTGDRHPGQQRAEGHFERGRIKARQGLWHEALQAYDQALAICPEPAYALQRGRALLGLGRLDAALSQAQKLVAEHPEMMAAHLLRAHLLSELRRFPEALAALVGAPGGVARDIHYWLALASAAERCEDHTQAATALLQALVYKMDDPQLYARLADAFRRLQRKEEAMECLRSALLFKHPQAMVLRSHRCLLLAETFQWELAEAELADLARDIQALPSEAPVQTSPWAMAALTSDPVLQHKASRHYAQFLASEVASPDPEYPVHTRLESRRLRVGYLSADFNAHATSLLMVQMLEAHHRDRFEVFAYSTSPSDRTAMRQRVERACEHFEDVWGLSDAELAKRIWAHQIDILVDLKGATDQGHPAVFIARPAPIQVAWLGFPGTTGAGEIDYVVGDPVVTPLSHASHYSEKIAQMPSCYQPNDQLRHLPQRTSRQALNLPDDAFVLCAFHQPYKVNRHVAQAWAQILQQAPNTLLWLLEWNDQDRAGFEGRLSKLGVPPHRVRHAPRIPSDFNLNRMAAADLFLDAWPCNAHTTASEALWAGLPVVTVKGETFASRVAASLLCTVGLPELVCADAEDYVRLVVRLAQERALASQMSLFLQQTRTTGRLFDGKRFARDFEALLQRMWARHEQGLPPDHLPAHVEEIGPQIPFFSGLAVAPQT